MPALRCAFVGDESLVAQCAEIARASGLTVAAIASRHPQVLAYAAEHGIASTDSAGDLAAGLAGHDLDVLFSVANLRVLPDDVLALAPLGINFHDGPLPVYAGLNVTTWAILNGEVEHGITWHEMTSRVDEGRVVLEERFPIAADETAFSLNARCYEAALRTFPAVAAAVAAGDLPLAPQPPGERRTFLRVDRPAAVVDPAVPATDLERTVRALAVGPRLRNTLGVLRLVLGDDVYVVTDAALEGDAPLRVATRDGDLLVRELATPEGLPVDAAEVAARHGADPVPRPVPALAAHDRDLARHEPFWIERLSSTQPAEAPGTSWSTGEVRLGAGIDEAALVAAVATWLARVTGDSAAAFSFTDADLAAAVAALRPLVAPPLARLDVDADGGFGVVRAAAAAELETLRRRGPYLRDLIGRDPELRGTTVEPAVRVEVVGGGGSALVHHRYEGVDVGAQLEVLLAAGLAGPDVPVRRLPMLADLDRAVLDDLNATAHPYDATATVDGLFRAQVAATPEAPALTFAGRTLSYRELATEVDRMTAALAAAGVGHRDRVGIALPRGLDMVVAVLATLSRGAAYVPLDPTYPGDRLAFMVGDAELRVVVDEPFVWEATAGDGSAGAVDHAPSDLAYVIYTSGSTGRPKGVMVEHGNVVSFFAAMDQVIDRDPPGVWLSVTSLSFDISVLELLWTLGRGFHVVLKADRGVPAASPAAEATRPVSLSLFYFAAGETGAADGYRLLLEGARFADGAGFEAVWTPERHFHAFGGSYPNPAVVSAAVAAVTERVAIRAGSVVLPLHSPVRVAEEWAVVDNLSGGRTAISFAAGWQPNDFVLNPTGYGRAKEELPAMIDLVRRLWRGETVEMPGHDGTAVPVRTLPRPVQDELPVWLTSAGSPSTFEQAGRLGVGVLTHLLGQSVEELATNVARYRAAWREAGHAGEGHVTLMLHTFLDRDDVAAREAARLPLKGYLSAAAGLLRNMASAFPTFAGSGKDADEAFRSLSEDELSQLLDMATDRYLRTSGLFGTSQDAAGMVERVSAVGVDEVACLVDFGVDTDRVVASFPLLAETKALLDARRGSAVAPDRTATSTEGGDDTVAALVARHGVTHLQCTPSLAAMLVADPADRRALTALRHMMVGGEALPTALAGELRRLVPGRLTNMYGPTETTIWSLVHDIGEVPDGPVPIGRPIANTTCHVLDRGGQPLPVGVHGELHIGGPGVTRGYHARPDLTAERFVERDELGRLYGTGDVARVHPDGWVEFAGRSDNQVKIRGHRIELGEIEAVLDAHPDVVQSVVVARGGAGAGGAGAPQLVAYVIVSGGRPGDGEVLRKHVAAALPDVMVPAAVVVLDGFPLTPNGKVDRKALPAPAAVAPARVVAPINDHEQLVAAIWSEELGRPVGRQDNFFDAGGHSLLAVQVFRRLSDSTAVPLALTDVFRYPTVAAFAAYMAAAEAGDDVPGASTSAAAGSARGARRRALARRRD